VHLTPVFITSTPSHQATRGEAIHQFDGAVMLNLQAFRQFTNSRTNARRQSLEGQQQLMLTRLHAGRLCRFLTEVQKAPELVPKFRQ
jgi:hypothetical protein